jgi:hypothetical protein
VTGEMEEERRNDAPTQEVSAAASSNLGATLLRVAWLAILCFCHPRSGDRWSAG